MIINSNLLYSFVHTAPLFIIFTLYVLKLSKKLKLNNALHSLLLSFLSIIGLIIGGTLHNSHGLHFNILDCCFWYTAVLAYSSFRIAQISVRSCYAKKISK